MDVWVVVGFISCLAHGLSSALIYSVIKKKKKIYLVIYGAVYTWIRNDTSDNQSVWFGKITNEGGAFRKQN